MPDRVIENPIINSPYREPGRHFVFDRDGITNEVAERRRPSACFVPAARQLELATEWTLDRISENREINEIRARVERWRRRGHPDVTPTTRALLEHWNDPERDNPVLFCQREAAATAIYIAEAAPRSGDVWIRNLLEAANAEHNNGLPRLALKMATGSGKTVVMAMLIAWQTLNKVANPRDARFARHFLVVTPGITIRDRLRVLRPEHPESYYRLRDLVPADLYGWLGQARMVITNFHALQLRETREGRGLASLTKGLLAGRADAPSPFLETPDQMVARVCRELGAGRREIVVLNDEAHHCYRGEPVPDHDADAEARARNAQARVWFTGLERVRRKLGIKTAYDLSATPFFLAGSGHPEGTLFPWTVSDFPLIDAIESGIVKIPRVPVDDGRVASRVTYRELWGEIRDQLPRWGRKDAGSAGAPAPPARLEGALRSLYRNYEKAFQRWRRSDLAESGETPPVFIVVCNNTRVSKLVFDFIAGGALPLFSNVEAGRCTDRPKTILVDSQRLESDEDPLREVANTVGKKGKPGEQVRCVVSVSMLTEGWDANTVTHILGIRAFGTQLLCEQVVGRGLRRRSYVADDTGMLQPEYAEVYGVPFSFIPASGSGPDPKPRPRPKRVHADPARATREITFPRVVGYRVELPDGRLRPEFGEDSRLVLTTRDLPAQTLEELRGTREQQVAFQLARLVLDRHLRDGLGNPRPWLFPPLVGVVRSWLRDYVVYHDGAFPGLLLRAEHAHHATERIANGLVRVEDDREEQVLPILRPYDPTGSTAEVDFDTLGAVHPTDERRCHVTHVVCGTGWERTAAQALEALPDVSAYVKNDHLGFTIPYTHLGQARQYHPDFLVRLRDPGDGLPRTLIVEVSGHEPPGATEQKAATARDLWVPAVNNHGGFGRWRFLEITDPTVAQADADLEAAFRALYGE
jgi:type III restriction enzyme